MATSVQSAQTDLNNNEFIQTLIKENDQLKVLNEKLFKRSLNQKRKILRLKKQLSDFIPKSSVKDDVKEVDNEESNIWEDVEEVIASYNISQ